MRAVLALVSVVVVSCASMGPAVVAVHPTTEALEQAKPVHVQAVRLHAQKWLACESVLLQVTQAGVLSDEDANERLSLTWVGDGCGKRKSWISTCPPLPGLGAATAPPGKVVCRVQSFAEGDEVVSDLGADYVVDEPAGSTAEATEFPYDD